MSQFDSLDFQNPLENTASILKGLAEEIHGLHVGLASEQRIRAHEINALRKTIEEEKGELPLRVAALTKEIEEWRKSHSHRFEKAELKLAELDLEVGARLERTETKLDVETAERLHVLQDVMKNFNADTAYWKGRCGAIERDVKDLKKALEQTDLVHAQRHDQCKMDVDKIASLLRENTLARGTFEYFTPCSGTPKRAMTPDTASPSSRSFTPAYFPPNAYVSSPSHALAPPPLLTGDAGTSAMKMMRLRLSGMS